MRTRSFVADVFCSLFLLMGGVLPGARLAAQEPVHWDVASRMRAEGFENSKVVEYTAYLSDVIGPRITASPAMRQAQSWLMGQMEEIGLSQVHTEPWGDHTVGWDMERVSVHMLEPDYQMVIGYPLAFTPGTPGPVIERAVAAVIQTPEDMERFRGRLKDAVVLATPPMSMTPRTAQDAFRHTEESLGVFETEGVDLFSARHARGQLSQANFRSQVPADELEAFYKAEGVAAVLQASIGSDGTVYVTGRATSRTDRSREGIENSIPTLSVATEHYNRIYRILERDIPVTMEVDVRVLIDDSDPRGYNVIAEIPGTDLAHEIVGTAATPSAL